MGHLSYVYKNIVKLCCNKNGINRCLVVINCTRVDSKTQDDTVPGVWIRSYRCSSSPFLCFLFFTWGWTCEPRIWRRSCGITVIKHLPYLRPGGCCRTTICCWYCRLQIQMHMDFAQSLYSLLVDINTCTHYTYTIVTSLYCKR